jgi:tetratricopeptide (TPR) repeat protein
MGLERLPVLLCWLLGLMGAVYSSSAAWVSWLGSHKSSIESLERALPLAEKLGLPTAGYSLALADLETEEEERHLRRALQADERSLPALSRMAILEEFRGNREGARKLVDQAIRYHRSYKSYMAGLTQAARWGETSRVEELAKGALRYCPRDADGVFAQLKGVAMAERVLGPDRREDYLRFLIGQKRFDEALVAFLGRKT